MKTVKFFVFLICILVLSSFSVQSQMIVPGSEALLAKLRLNESIDGLEIETYATITGDPYLYKDFHEGELILRNGEKYKLNLRFDIYGNQVHLKNNENIFGIIHPERIALIIIDTVKLFYCYYVNSPGSESSKHDSYFILKTDGKCKLLLRKNIRIQDAEPPKLYQDAKPAKFILTDDTYYFKLGDKSAVRIRSKKELLSVLSDHKEALSRFISSNRLGIKDVEDLVRIVSYYNGL